MFILNGYLLVFLCSMMVLVQATDDNAPSGRNSSKLIDRIVGGSPIFIRQAPYQIALFYRTRFSCGGTIIGERRILTASHCVNGRNKKLFNIRAGSSVFYNGGTVVRVIKVTQHPKYNRYTFDYDFAILTLEKSLNFDEFVQPISIASFDEINEEDRAYVLGWGSLGYEQSVSPILMRVLVPIIPNEVCNQLYKSQITDHMLCAGYLWGGKDACQGDSGGPLVDAKRNVLIGVVSWGRKCAEPNYPGVYGRVASVSQWIQQTY